MKRRDVVRALLTPDPLMPDQTDPAAPPPRVASHAVRAIGLEIGRLAEEAEDAAALRRQIETGSTVVELDPALVDPSFATDRLAPTEDTDYRRLVESIRTSGQLAPILVRPHPERPGRFQVAYGHRRLAAAAELRIAVRAVVRPLSDAELVVAQGKENAERRNLSFIERAWFAATLAAAGFDRATLNAALSVHTAETTRLLAVAAAVPAALIRAIGPAPKAGRPRWMELAALLDEAPPAALDALLADPAFRRLSSDRRFEQVLTTLRAATATPEGEAICDEDGHPVIRVERAARQLRLVVDLRRAPGLDALLLDSLPDLLRAYTEAKRR
jgi:ParB family chromosome partitioning protein